MPDVSAIMAEMLARARAANAPQASPNHPVVVPGLGRKKAKTVEASVDLKQIEDFFNKGDEEKAKATDKLFEVWNMMGADPDAAPAREALFSNPVIQKQMAERFGKDPRIMRVDDEDTSLQSPIGIEGEPIGKDKGVGVVKEKEGTGERYLTNVITPASRRPATGGSEVGQPINIARYKFVDLAAPEQYQKEVTLKNMSPEMREKHFREPSKGPLDFFSGETATDDEIAKYKQNTAMVAPPTKPLGTNKNAQKVLEDWNAYYLQAYGKLRDQYDPKDAEFNYQNLVNLGGKAKQTINDLRASGAGYKDMSGVVAAFRTAVQKEFRALDPATPSNIEKMKHYVTEYQDILAHARSDYAGDYADLMDLHNYLAKRGVQGYSISNATEWMREIGLTPQQIEQIGKRTLAFKEQEAADKIRKQAELDEARKIFKNAQIYLEDRKKPIMQRILGSTSRGYFGVLRGEAAYKWALENGPKYGLYLKGGKDER